jgi:DtxR family Mn-dependent transcriptional regulator
LSKFNAISGPSQKESKMNPLSLSEENHLKAIYQILSEQDKTEGASTNAIAERLRTKASSVTDMLQKLSEKNLLHYKKYQGVSLTSGGKKIAITVLRKHRLWEFFLVEKLKFRWDEVHDIAEQLEHIQSEELINRLDKYLSYPRFDPHGDPIPDVKGKMVHQKLIKLSEMDLNEKCRVMSVSNHGDSSALLQYLDQLRIIPGSGIQIRVRYDFDNSLSISVNRRAAIHISQEVARNILVSTL